MSSNESAPWDAAEVAFEEVMEEASKDVRAK
jgi:hypothetical protein